MSIQVNDSENYYTSTADSWTNRISTIQMHFYMDLFNKYVVDAAAKNLHDNAGDARDVVQSLGQTGYPGVGKDNPLQFLCLFISFHLLYL